MRRVGVRGLASCMKVSGQHHGQHTPNIQRFSEPQSGTQAPEKGTLGPLLTGCVTLAESAGVSRTSLGWSVWISEVHRERFKNHGILGLEALLLFSFR